METHVPADGVTVPVEEAPPSPVEPASAAASDPFEVLPAAEPAEAASLATDPNTRAAPPAQKKKPAAKRAHRADAPPPTKSKKEVKKMAPKKEKGNGADKVGLAITADTARQIRRLRAAMEMKTGDRVTNSDAIQTAVKAYLKET